MKKQELNEILRNHKLWLISQSEEGKRADLRGADIEGADLEDANLRGADLWGARGIASFNTLMGDNRIGYAVKHKDCVMVKSGCFWGTSEKAVIEIRKKYGENSYYEKIVRLYTEILNK